MTAVVLNINFRRRLGRIQMLLFAMRLEVGTSGGYEENCHIVGIVVAYEIILEISRCRNSIIRTMVASLGFLRIS